MTNLAVVAIGLVAVAALIVDPLTGTALLTCSVAGFTLWQRRSRRS
jgi:hypothetical protein